MILTLLTYPNINRNSINQRDDLMHVTRYILDKGNKSIIWINKNSKIIAVTKINGNTIKTMLISLLMK